MRFFAFMASLFYVFLIPWENSITIGEMGTVARVTGLVVAALWVVTILPTGRFRRPVGLHVVVFSFVLWNVLSVFWSFEVEETLQRVKTIVQLFGMAWVVWDLTTSLTALRAMLQAYILGSYVAIASTVANFMRGVDVGLRYTGANLNANELAMILALGLPVAWHLGTSARNSKGNHLLKLVNYAYIPAGVFVILLTGSRMGLFVIMPTVLFMVGTSSRLKFFPRIFIFATLISVLFALYPYIPRATFERLATAKASIETADLGGRVAIWREGVKAWLEHPILGIGGGAFPIAARGNQAVAHNTFLSILVELGVVGFTLFGVILAMTIYQALCQPKWFSWLWLTVLLIWSIGALSLTLEATKPTWLFLSLVLVGASVHSESNTSTSTRGGRLV